MSGSATVTGASAHSKVGVYVDYMQRYRPAGQNETYYWESHRPRDGFEAASGVVSRGGAKANVGGRATRRMIPDPGLCVPPSRYFKEPRRAESRPDQQVCSS